MPFLLSRAATILCLTLVYSSCLRLCIGLVYAQHLDITTPMIRWDLTCRYKNDPSIFAWNLINEPRCQK